MLTGETSNLTFLNLNRKGRSHAPSAGLIRIVRKLFSTRSWRRRLRRDRHPSTSKRSRGARGVQLVLFTSIFPTGMVVVITHIFRAPTFGRHKSLTTPECLDTTLEER